MVLNFAVTDAKSKQWFFVLCTMQNALFVLQEKIKEYVATAKATAQAEPQQQQHTRTNTSMHATDVEHGQAAEQANASSNTAAAPSIDAGTLQLMETQLGRLSGIIKGHEAEINQLRQALTDAYAERRQLQLANAALLSTKQQAADSTNGSPRIAAAKQPNEQQGATYQEHRSISPSGRRRTPLHKPKFK